MLLEFILRMLNKDWSHLTPNEIALLKDYIRYSASFEHTITELERGLHSTDDPKHIAMKTLITACEFYEADWCGILLLDLDIGVWRPYWWYDVKRGEMADTAFHEFEFSEEFGRWVTALKAGDPVIIEDVDALRETNPAEYRNYKRLEASSIIGVPFWKRPTGFIVIRNPKRNKVDPNMLRIMAYVAVSTVNENRMAESFRMRERKPEIHNENDVYVNLMGNVEIHSMHYHLDESRVNAPMGWNILVYLLLHRERHVSYTELINRIWPEEDAADPSGKIRGAIYRFRHSVGYPVDKTLVVSEPAGYVLNPDLNITTDTDLFEKYWHQAKDLNDASRIEILKKAFSLYRGPLYMSEKSATWLMDESFRLAGIYASVVSELLEALYRTRDYAGVRDYATKAIQMDPMNLQAHYWLTASLAKSRNRGLAKQALAKAKEMLGEEDYADVLYQLENQNIKLG